VETLQGTASHAPRKGAAQMRKSEWNQAVIWN